MSNYTNEHSLYYSHNDTWSYVYLRRYQHFNDKLNIQDVNTQGYSIQNCLELMTLKFNFSFGWGFKAFVCVLYTD